MAGRVESSGSRQARAAETAVAIKSAAREVFAEKGYLNSKITDITARASRAAGSFYNHFGSKEELLEALMADIASETGKLVADHGGEYHDLSDPAVLYSHIEVFWQVYTSHVVEIEAMGQAALVDAETARRMYQWRAQQIRPWQDHLQGMADSGVPLAGTPQVLAPALAAIMEGYCHSWLAEDRPVSEDVAIRTLTTLLCRGIRGDG